MVEKLTKEAISDLLVIEGECFGSEQWNEAMLAAEFDNPLAEIFGIRRKGIVVAYLSVCFAFDEAHIGNLAVLPSFRRKGLAKKLLEALFKQCAKNNITSFTLEVSKNNEPALTLYESCGFVLAGVRKRYYRNGDDALIMWKYNN